ncbi:hypothetical protein C4K03_3426 [Pseudomonas synxantha]|uniref:Uncharacterized protein n=1 Tax=Pseudomonas synxantha TaxID=47883 RepID=A0A3G7UAN1_9PSED|nr:hypothetical protein C4K03_3426 [Pseudomonas synxantha]
MALDVRQGLGQILAQILNPHQHNFELILRSMWEGACSR